MCREYYPQYFLLSLSPLFTLALQPGVTHSLLTVVMETERWTGSWVTRFMLDFFKLAICSFTLWDQRPNKDTTFFYLCIIKYLVLNVLLCLFPRNLRFPPQHPLSVSLSDQVLFSILKGFSSLSYFLFSLIINCLSFISTSPASGV